LQQNHFRPDVGASPIVYTGSLTESLAHAKQWVPLGTPMLVLARKHATVAQARLGATGYSTDPWATLREAQEERERFLMHVAVAVDLAQRGIFDVAVHRLVQGLSSRHGFRKPIAFDGPVDITMRRSVALMILEHLLAKHQELLAQTALDFYNTLFAYLPICLEGMSLPAVRAGKFRDAASAVRYHDLFHSLNSPDETRSIRTVHKAKGAEASAVFVVLDDSQADHILNPVINDEEQRITYVALSRAQDHLFVFCTAAGRLPEFEAIAMTTHEIGVASITRSTRRRTRPTATG
jgi:DNA helicase-2/ATP-dependent DNA helicase PcrA